MSIDKNGNVGIGTTSPGRTLDVIGTFRTNTSVDVGTGTQADALLVPGSLTLTGSGNPDPAYLDLRSDSSDQINFKTAGGTLRWQMYSSTVGATPDFNILEDATSRFFIKNGGNIGVGTTTPAVILDINGQANAKGLSESSQSVSIGSGATTFAADGSGIVLMTESGGSASNISTITGCNSGAVRQGQVIKFIAIVFTSGAIAFIDTAVGTATADSIIIAGNTSTNNIVLSAATVGSSFTLICTTIASTKRWVEISRSLNTN
jgi:hypothetical protein